MPLLFVCLPTYLYKPLWLGVFVLLLRAVGNFCLQTVGMAVGSLVSVTAAYLVLEDVEADEDPKPQLSKHTMAR